MQTSSLNSSKFLSPEEDQALLNRLKGDTSRNALMISLLRICGMRAGELLSLRLCDLNPFEKTIRITASKGSKDRELPLPDDVFARLMRYAVLERRADYEMIFNIKYNMLGEIWRGIRPIGCGKKLHALRHTKAIRIYEQTKDLLLVKSQLGHKSVQTTMIYQDFAYTKEAFKAVVSL